MPPEPTTITVTSATQSEADVRASLEPAAPAAPEAAPEQVIEQEADSPKTDAEVSEAARTLRRSRSEKKVLKEIALRKQAEERAFRLEQQLAEHTAAARPATPTPSAPAADAAPAAAPLAAPQFTFPTFDEYQAKHPDADYDAYQDARSDARDAWREGVKRATAAHEARKEAVLASRRAEAEAAATYETHKEAFAAKHPDYDEVLNRVQLPAVLDAQGRKVDAPVVGPFRDLLLRAGADAPQILYYLGQHPDVADRVFTSRGPADLIATFTEVKLRAVGPSSARPPTPAAAARPSRPVTDAPPPLSAVPGGATHIPSLQQLADGDDDADAYIARRRQDLKRLA